MSDQRLIYTSNDVATKVANVGGEKNPPATAITVNKIIERSELRGVTGIEAEWLSISIADFPMIVAYYSTIKSFEIKVNEKIIYEKRVSPYGAYRESVLVPVSIRPSDTVDIIIDHTMAPTAVLQNYYTGGEVLFLKKGAVRF